jgi:hypothetical protein
MSKLTGLTFFAVLLLAAPLVGADGMVHIYDEDMWGLFHEQQQFCAINYQEGFQNMILMVDTSEELRGEKAVWIFPVPAKPEGTMIGIIKGFPSFLGYDIKERAQEAVSSAFGGMVSTQIYAIPFIMWFGFKQSFGAVGGRTLGASYEGITVHQRIEKMGLATELVSAADAASLSSYLSDKGLNLGNSRSILDEYVGKEYSFVVSWISDIDKFKQEQAKAERQYDSKWTGNTVGVFIRFPTEKMYYPLKPTSVYGNERVPAVIYVVGYVEPDLYPEIKADTEVNYFLHDYFTAPEELSGFFSGLEMQASTYYEPVYDTQKKAESTQEKAGFTIKNLRYTKIKINAPANYLTQDLWIENSMPRKIKNADFVNGFSFWQWLLVFGACSCLASLISAVIVFRRDSPSLPKFLVFGLFNLLTLAGFSIVAYKTRIDNKFTKAKETGQQRANFRKVMDRSSLISLVIPSLMLVFFVYEMIATWSSAGTFEWILSLAGVLFGMLCLYGIIVLLVGPFVWGYYNNRKIMKFTIMFSLVFVGLTLLCKYLFSTILM